MNGSKEFGSLVNITKQKLEKWTHTHTISTTRTTKSKKKLVVLSIRRNLIRSIFVLFCSIYLCICAHTFFDLAMQASKPSNHRPHHRFHHHRRISSLNFRFFFFFLSKENLNIFENIRNNLNTTTKGIYTTTTTKWAANIREKTARRQHSKMISFSFSNFSYI